MLYSYMSDRVDSSRVALLKPFDIQSQCVGNAKRLESRRSLTRNNMLPVSAVHRSEHVARWKVWGRMWGSFLNREQYIAKSNS